MATLPTLTAYDPNLIPNKATMTDEEFADAIHPYLNFWNETTIPEINTWRGTLEQIRQEINDKYIAVKNQAVDGGYSQAYLDTKYNPPMSRTYYVDQVNGNDANDGSSAHPFKTIKKACDSVPVGGHGKIVIYGDYNNTQIESIGLDKKNIMITLKGTMTIRYIDNGSYSYPSLYFALYGSHMIFAIDSHYGGRIVFSDYDATKTIAAYRSGLINVDNRYVSSVSCILRVREDNYTPIYLGNKSVFVNCDTWAYDVASFVGVSIAGHYVGTNREIVAHTQSCILNTHYANSALYIIYSGGYKDQNGNSETATQFATSRTFGIVRDADGKPRNIISNIVL